MAGVCEVTVSVLQLVQMKQVLCCMQLQVASSAVVFRLFCFSGCGDAPDDPDMVCRSQQ